MRFSLMAAVTASIAVLLASCCNSGQYIYHEGIVWNTAFHITYQSDRNLNDSILSALRQVENSVSVFKPGSVVSRVNSQSATGVDDLFINVYMGARKVWHESDGAFDPTISPLITAWGFGKGHRVNTEVDVDSLLQFVGFGKTSLQGNRISKHDIRTEFNFSAIAKGFGCDYVGEMLKRNGVRSYLVEIGGEIAVAGVNPKGKKWNISIDRPVVSKKEIHNSIMTVRVTDAGIATSGNYRNFNEIGNKKFGHTIDTKTGRPATTDILSATVIAPQCMLADAYATACIAMGSDRAKKMIRRLDLAVMLVLSDSEIWMSDAFKTYAK